MPHEEFLRLLQMVESGRRCEGKESLDIQDDNIGDGRALDQRKAAHNNCKMGEPDCAECTAINRDKTALRERMHSQGVDFPVEVFEA